MSDEIKSLMIQVSATTELLRSQLTTAENKIAQFGRSTEAATQRVERNFKQVGVAAGQQKAGLQQLSFQLNDISTMYAMGARPMQIFASQMGQVLQAVQLSTGGTSKLAAFLGGPWGMAITAGAVALTPFVAKLFDTADAADTATNALDSLVKKRADALSQQFQLRDAEKGLNDLLKEREAIYKGTGNGGFGGVARFGDMARDNRDALAKLAAIDKDIAEKRAALDRERVVRAMGESGAGIWGGSAPSRFVTPRVAGSRSGGGAGRSGGRSATDPASTIMRTEMERMELNGRNVFDKIMSSEPAQADLERIDKTLAYYEEANKEVQARLAMVEENRVQYMAGLFETAFNGGTDAIWDNFENIGKQVISRVLAEFAMSQIGGKGGFNLGGAIGTAFTSILGFADGGRPPVGRVSMVGERGPELFVPDAAGTIIPNHALGGGGMNFTINAPGATAETVAMIRRELANAAPALISAASGNTVRALNRKSL